MATSDETLLALADCADRASLTLVAKPHPLFPKAKYESSRKRLSITWLDPDISVWDAIEWADIVVTNVSGSALVALILGKAVAVSSLHSIARISNVQVFSNREDLEHILGSEYAQLKVETQPDYRFFARYIGGRCFSVNPAVHGQLLPTTDALVARLVRGFRANGPQNLEQ